MNDTFDWGGLTAEIVKGHFAKYPVDLLHLLRTRIEAAFVPVERYALELFDATAHGELKTLEALARAEAAEAECLEQARLLGMSGERELALRAELARVKDQAEAAEARVSELTAQLATARESERAAMTEVNGLKDALAQVPEFICRKCGRRQDGPTDNEARF